MEPATGIGIGIGAATTGMAKLAETQLVQDVYKDVLKKPLKKTSDIVSTALGGVGKLIEAVQERTIAALIQAEEMVPVERRIPPAAEVVGPAIMNMLFLEDDSLARQMFIKLIARAMDKDRKTEAFPGFVRIVEQLSPDEAVVLRNLTILPDGNPSFTFITKSKSDWLTYLNTPPRSRIIGERIDGEISSISVPSGTLAAPDRLRMYISHLASLSLIELWQMGYETLKDETPFRVNYALAPTDFGECFRIACIID